MDNRNYPGQASSDGERNTKHGMGDPQKKSLALQEKKGKPLSWPEMQKGRHIHSKSYGRALHGGSNREAL